MDAEQADRLVKGWRNLSSNDRPGVPLPKVADVHLALREMGYTTDEADSLTLAILRDKDRWHLAWSGPLPAGMRRTDTPGG